MKTLAYVALAVAVVSLIVGIISRFTQIPIALVPGGLKANVFLAFTNTCLLLAIALGILKGKE